MKDLYSMKVPLENTWIVACPQRSTGIHEKRVHAWTLTQEVIDNIGTDYEKPLIPCYVCGHFFSLVEGINEAFTMDLNHVVNYFASNTVQSGDVRLRPGWIRPVKFPKPFSSRPAVYLFANSNPPDVVPGHTDNYGFRIFTGKWLEAVREEYQVSWTAYGNVDEDDIPIWRKIISIAKNDQSRNDFRLEVVNLGSAVELFVKEYLRPMLRMKGFTGLEIDEALRKGIEVIMSKFFKEATGEIRNSGSSRPAPTDAR